MEQLPNKPGNTNPVKHISKASGLSLLTRYLPNKLVDLFPFAPSSTVAAADLTHTTSQLTQGDCRSRESSSSSVATSTSSTATSLASHQYSEYSRDISTTSSHVSFNCLIPHGCSSLYTTSLPNSHGSFDHVRMTSSPLMTPTILPGAQFVPPSLAFSSTGLALSGVERFPIPSISSPPFLQAQQSTVIAALAWQPNSNAYIGPALLSHDSSNVAIVGQTAAASIPEPVSVSRPTPNRPVVLVSLNASIVSTGHTTQPDSSLNAHTEVDFGSLADTSQTSANLPATMQPFTSDHLTSGFSVFRPLVFPPETDNNAPRYSSFAFSFVDLKGALDCIYFYVHSLMNCRLPFSTLQHGTRAALTTFKPISQLLSPSDSNQLVCFTYQCFV